MEIVRRIFGAYLVLMAIIVVVNLAVTPLYHDGSDEYTVWEIVNYFMAVAVVIVLVIGILRKRAIDGEEDVDTLTYLRTSFVFYGAIVLASLFFWEWFWQLNPESETGLAVNSHMIYFPAMDCLFSVLCLIVGRRVWSAGGN